MKYLAIGVLVVGLATSGAAAQAGDSDAAAAPGQAAEEGEDEEIVVEGELPKEKRRVCEMRTGTGSIVPRRVCRTLAQLEEEQRAAGEAVDRITRDREARNQIQLNRQPGG